MLDLRYVPLNTRYRGSDKAPRSLARVRKGPQEASRRGRQGLMFPRRGAKRAPDDPNRGPTQPCHCPKTSHLAPESQRCPKTLPRAIKKPRKPLKFTCRRLQDASDTPQIPCPEAGVRAPNKTQEAYARLACSARAPRRLRDNPRWESKKAPTKLTFK